MVTKDFRMEKKMDIQEIRDLEGFGIISLCLCPYCEGTKYISYATSYRFGKTKYYICVKNFGDFCLVSFWHGCHWGVSYPTSGAYVAEGLIDCGEDRILYHLDFFRGE
jgi:hypothetical protein